MLTSGIMAKMSFISEDDKSPPVRNFRATLTAPMARVAVPMAMSEPFESSNVMISFFIFILLSGQER